MSGEKVTVTRPENFLDITCEKGCLVALGYRREYDLRIAARAHVRDTGHAVTVTVTERARYARPVVAEVPEVEDKEHG